jgi:hypothetical protein
MNRTSAFVGARKSRTKTLHGLILASIVSLGACAAASAQTASQCIELTPDRAGFKLMRTDTSNLGLPSKEPLAGTSAYIVGYVEHRDTDGESPTISSKPYGVYIFRTTGGRFLIRIEDIPEGHGWYGPF